MKNARINLTPGHEHIEINGHDITNACRAVTIHGAVSDLPTIELDLAALDLLIEITQFEDREPRAMVNLPDDARKALIACGWTPPATATF